MSDNFKNANRMIRIIIAVSFGGVGLTTGLLFVLSGIYRAMFPTGNIWLSVAFICTVAALGFSAGYFMGPSLIEQSKLLVQWWENKLVKIPAIDLLGGILGLIIGLIIAFFIGSPLSGIPIVGRFLPTVVSVFLGYLGASLGMKKRDEVFLTISRVRGLTARDRKKDMKLFSDAEILGSGIGGEDLLLSPGRERVGEMKILDTSVIIDGRIADIYRTGFLSGTIVVPSFVLAELQRIADSSDGIKRNRGRRGLDILNAMRKEMGEDMQVAEASFPEAPDVDSKLVLLARQTGGEILTNDYNLNKVAELQGIRVLNINDLVNAVKQVFLPGEEMVVSVQKEGKEQRQGIGYLDDGTMIVVEMGRKYINHTIYTVVTSVLQTSAGRMIFVKPKYADKRVYAEEEA